MTKGELVEALKNFDDNVEIIIEGRHGLEGEVTEITNRWKVTERCQFPGCKHEHNRQEVLLHTDL